MRKVRILNPLTRMRLNRQLILLFLILVSPVFLLNWYANMKAEQILKSHVTNAYEELNKQNYALISRDIDTINRIITTSIIQNPVTQDMTPENADTFDLVQKYQTADKLLSSYSTGVSGGGAVYYYLYVYDPMGLYPFAPNTSSKFKQGGVYFYSDTKKPEWIDSVIEKKGRGSLRIMNDMGTFSQSDTLAFVRAVNSTTEGNKTIGVLVATNLNKKIEQTLTSVSLPDAGEIYLTDQANRILASTTSEIGKTIQLPQSLPVGGEFAGTADAIEDGFIYVQYYDNELGQKLIYKISTQSMLQQQNELKNVIQLISIAYSLFAIVIMTYFWRSLLNPLQRLAVFTRTYAPGKVVPMPSGDGRGDEVGVLIHSVYGMAHRLNLLIEDQYKLEIKQKEAQLQLLYQQINPHLLYNTLESIYWKSSLEGNTESAEMIKELAKLMRISLSRGRELITLQEELEHAAAYIILQKKRYEYGFDVHWNIAEDALHNLIPKITLQPLIENAILHGIRSMGEDGEIIVSAVRDGERVIICIEDNGYKETDYESINALLGAAQSNSQSAGYGIRNVQMRIQLHFGQTYGLQYAKRPGGGTVATLTLPISMDPEQTEAAAG